MTLGIRQQRTVISGRWDTNSVDREITPAFCLKSLQTAVQGGASMEAQQSPRVRLPGESREAKEGGVCRDEYCKCTHLRKQLEARVRTTFQV